MVPLERERPLPGGESTRLSRAAGPLFTVVVPTRGDPRKLSRLLDALARQTLSTEQREIVLAFDGAPIPSEITDRVRELGVRIVESSRRKGPGAARNAGAREANGAYLAFTEDDCTPAPDWLQVAAARIEREPGLDLLEGATLLPNGRPARRGLEPHFLPTNLIVRREWFERLGGYTEEFFDDASGVYFREDSDFGFSLESTGARMGVEPRARVEHPFEHPGLLDPIRWARRYEMDALLGRRHPSRFHERIEVHRIGPFILRRPLVRLSWIYILALATALVGAVTDRSLIPIGLAVAAVCLVPFWAKWGFHPARLPVLPFVPPVLAYSLLEGRMKLESRMKAAALRLGDRQPAAPPFHQERRGQAPREAD